MFNFFLVAILLALVGAFYSFGESDERVEASRQAHIRIESQDAILADLHSMKDATVSELASDWRRAYPKPSATELSELREIQQLINKDKTLAAKMTASYRMKNDPFCNGMWKPVVGSSDSSCRAPKIWRESPTPHAKASQASGNVKN